MFRNRPSFTFGLVLVTVLVLVCAAPVSSQVNKFGFINAHHFIKEFINNQEDLQSLASSAAQKYLGGQQQQLLDGAAIEDVDEQTIYSGFFSELTDNHYNVSLPCVLDVSLILEHLRNMTQAPWALQMLDAQGKLPSGILEGDLKWLGSYEQCRNITALQVLANSSTGEPEELFKGKYCVANIHKGNMSAAGAANMPGFGSIALTLGMCVPSSCSDRDAQHLVYTGLFSVDLLLNTTDINTEVVCPKKLSVSEDGRAITAIVICSLLAAFILTGTLYDLIFIQTPTFLMERAIREHSLIADDLGNGVPPLSGSENLQEKTPLLGSRTHPADHIVKDKGKACQFLLAFSLYSNGAKILSTKQGSSSLRCLNGIRFLSMTWVMLGHSYSFGLEQTSNVLPFLVEMIKRWTFMGLINATYSVDTFFFLSGLLVTYLCMKEMDKKKGNFKINWGMFYFHRFWRLTPPYMLVLMFDTCLFRYLGEGPLWKQQGVEIDFCANTWWRNLLYINNFFKMEEMCMAWSWYLANDMQFFIISPIILIPLYSPPSSDGAGSDINGCPTVRDSQSSLSDRLKHGQTCPWDRSGKLGGAVLTFLLLVCLVSTGAISRAYEIGVGFLDAKTVLEGFDKIYITPWCRIGPYLIGMAVGYILYKYNCKVRLNMWLVLLAWAVAAVCCLSVLYGVYDVYQGHPMNVDTAALYNSVSRTVWALGLGWLTFACCTGYGGFINTFLSWEAFIPLSRLTYCAYLIHPLVMYYYFSSQRTLVYANDLTEIYIFLGNLVVSYGLAFVTSLVFEAPFMGLEKVIFAREKSV